MVSRRGKPRLVTIGYEGRTIHQLVDDLLDEDVDLLVDVRQRAMSRKVGFGKTALGAASVAAGIEYVHEPTLGNPKENREPFHRGDPHALHVYDQQMHSVGTDGLHRLEDLVLRRRVALLCFERDARICHRSSIAAWLHHVHPDLTIVDL